METDRKFTGDPYNDALHLKPSSHVSSVPSLLSSEQWGLDLGCFPHCTPDLQRLLACCTLYDSGGWRVVLCRAASAFDTWPSCSHGISAFNMHAGR